MSEQGELRDMAIAKSIRAAALAALALGAALAVTAPADAADSACR